MSRTARGAGAVAEQLGYHANPQAQALRRGRTTTYGFVVRNFANPFFLEVLSGPSRSRRSQATDGVSGVARVCPDNAAAVGLAAHRLAELGHACIGFLSAPRGLMADPDRLRHFRLLAGAT